MALVQCPECGKSVSDSCKRCIHCGVEFTVCKECGTLYAGGGACPACGFGAAEEKSSNAFGSVAAEKTAEPLKTDKEFEQTMKAERKKFDNQNIAYAEKLESAYNTWKSDTNASRNTIVVFDVLHWIGTALCIIALLVLILSTQLQGQPKNILELADTLSKFEKVIIAFNVLFACGELCRKLKDFSAFYETIKWEKWLVKKELNLTEELKAVNNMELGFSFYSFKKRKLIAIGNRMKEAYYLSKHPNEKTLYVWLNVISSLLSIAVSVIVIVLSVQAYRGAAAAMLIDEISKIGIKTFLSFVPVSTWVMFGVFAAGSMILGFAYPFHRRIENWYKTIVPESSQK